MTNCVELASAITGGFCWWSSPPLPVYTSCYLDYCLLRPLSGSVQHTVADLTSLWSCHALAGKIGFVVVDFLSWWQTRFVGQIQIARWWMLDRLNWLYTLSRTKKNRGLLNMWHLPPRYAIIFLNVWLRLVGHIPLYTNIWRFPETGVPTVIIHFSRIVRFFNQPFLGIPHGYGNPCLPCHPSRPQHLGSWPVRAPIGTFEV